MKPNITMIGMPSSGKSTIGVLLAKRLGFSFVDVDIVIQEKEGRLLMEIIAGEGMDGFLKVEERVNAALSLYERRDSFAALRRRSMQSDFSGDASAGKYMALYRQM